MLSWGAGGLAYYELTKPASVEKQTNTAIEQKITEQPKTELKLRIENISRTTELSLKRVTIDNTVYQCKQTQQLNNAGGLSGEDMACTLEKPGANQGKK